MSLEKLKALTHFIISECEPEKLGAIRLNKAIWFSDIITYQMEGASITGEDYLKRQHGPVPKRILKALDALKKSGAIEIKEKTAPYEVRKFFSMKDPASSALLDREKRTARAALDAILGNTANEISEITHDNIWQAVGEGEDIPLCATLVACPKPFTSEIQNWAKGIAKNANSTAR